MIYIILINIFSFVVFGIDKQRAIKGKWRISEKFLFTLAILGGSFGILLGMKCFRHKTKKRKFTVGIPLAIILQIYLYYKMGGNL